MSEAKQELVRNWLLKASHDLTAARLLVAPDVAILDVAIYHCQQAAEKALKGFLVFWDQRTEKTHNLVSLLQKAAEIEPCFLSWADAAKRLTPYATAYRYPGAPAEPDLEQVEEALEDAACIYNQVLSYLPTAVNPATTGPASD